MAVGIAVPHDPKTEVICHQCHKPIKKGKRAIARHMRSEHFLYISERRIELHEDGWSYSYELPVEIDHDRIKKLLKFYKSLTAEEKALLLEPVEAVEDFESY